MIEDKEKLVELIKESLLAIYCGDCLEEDEIDISDEEVVRIAEYLIDNGVRVLDGGYYEN